MTEMTIRDEDVSKEARESIRLSFNPSGDQTVQEIKFLACALMTRYQQIRDKGNAGREAKGMP